MRRKKTNRQNILLTMLMVIVLAMGQIPFIAFADSSQGQSSVQQGATTFDDGKQIPEGSTMPTAEGTGTEQGSTSTKHKIQATALPGGKVATSPACEAAAGEIISIEAIPNNGYKLAAIDVNDAAGASIDVEEGKFEMPSSNVDVRVSFSLEENSLDNGNQIPNLSVPSFTMNRLLSSPFNLLGNGNNLTSVSIFYTDGGATAFAEQVYSGQQISIVPFDDFAQFGPPERQRFAGWNVSAGDVSYISAEQIAQGYTFTVPEFGGNEFASLTFSANFEDDTYNVAFDINGGSPTITTQTVYNGEKASQPTATFTKGDWTFAGWYPDEQYTEKYNFESPVTNNMTLHARWNGNLTVDTYDKSWDEPGGGSFDYNVHEGTGTGFATYSSANIPEGSSVSLTAHPANGYRFVGWAAADDPDELVSTSEQYSFIMSEAKIALQAVFEENPVSLTVHWSSLDGVDLLEPIVYKDIAKGTRLFKALEDNGVDFFDAHLFEKDGYISYNSSWTLRPMNEYASSDEFDSARLLSSTELNSDMDVYFAMAKTIAAASASIEAPICGTETLTPIDRPAMMAQTNPPKLSVPEGSNYSLDTENDTLPGIWVNTDDTEKPYIGKFTGGNSYCFDMLLESDYGYAFASDCKFTLDGGTTKEVSPGVRVLSVAGMVVAAHVPGESVKENIIEPTCTETGSYDKVVYCSSCGEKLSSTYETIEALGHKWDEWKVTKEATKQEEGVQERICLRCGELEKESIPKLAVKEASLAWQMPKTGDSFAIVVGIIGGIIALAIGGLIYAAWRRNR